MKELKHFFGVTYFICSVLYLIFVLFIEQYEIMNWETKYKFAYLFSCGAFSVLANLVYFGSGFNEEE